MPHFLNDPQLSILHPNPHPHPLCHPHPLSHPHPLCRHPLSIPLIVGYRLLWTLRALQGSTTAAFIKYLALQTLQFDYQFR